MERLNRLSNRHMLNYHIHTLENGLRIVHKPTKRHVSFCGFFVNAGSRDERQDEYGMAHFVEHMMFKGTQKRKSFHIINRMEAVGGELNAFTNKEETVIYSSFLEEDFERAIELLTDLVFNSQYPQSEVEKEREVIIDEIHSYEDSPSELIFDEFENLIFRNSELGHNILGDEKTLNGFDSEKIKTFTQERYNLSQIVFFSTGNTDFKKIVRLAEKYLAPIRTKESTLIREKAIINEAQHITLEKDTNQAHVIMGSRCYDIHDKRRRILLLLNNILGGPGMNSRLNISLREKKGYVYTVESSITGYSDAGILSIYFGSDPQNSDKCIKLVQKELKLLRENKLTSIQLHRAKKQLIGQIGLNSDNLESTAISLGKSIFLYNKFDSLEEVFHQISEITAEDLLDVANEILAPDQMTMLSFR